MTTATPIATRVAAIVEVLEVRYAETLAAIRTIEAFEPQTEAGHVHKLSRRAELIMLKGSLIDCLKTFRAVSDDLHDGSVDATVTLLDSLRTNQKDKPS